MNEPSTVTEAVETKPTRKWTSEAGPIQTKKAFQAIKALVQEGQTYSEKWGVLGVDEKEMSFYSPFGGGREDAGQALTEIAERFDYKITAANYQNIIQLAQSALDVLKANRPVRKDTRQTPEEAEASRARAQEAQAEREIEVARKQIPDDAALADSWVHTAKGFREQIAGIADRAAKTITEVYTLWRGYAQACQNSDQSALISEFEQNYRAELTPPVFVKVRHRGHLRELVEAGQVELVGSYHYDEMTGQSGFEGPPKPVRMCPDDRSQRQEGIVYVFSSDFDGKCGGMTQGKTGIVHLRVHSNSSYDFRIKPAAVSENGQNNPPALHQDAASSGSASGIVVRRNLEHNGVEVCFPSKPDGAIISRLKGAGFRWSMRSKVWYKKFNAEAWAQAHEIAGLPLALSGASVESDGQTDDLQTEAASYNEQLQAAKKLFPGEAKALDRFDMAVEDRMSDACGLNGQPE